MSAISTSAQQQGPGAPGPPRKRSSVLRPARVALYLTLFVVALIYVYPFLIAIATSFKTQQDAASNAISLIPQVWSTHAYERLFAHSDFPLWFKNSVIVTVTVTIGRVFLSSLAGYALARVRFPGRKVLFAALVAVMAVPGVVLLIPRFLVINQLNIYDTYGALIIPLLADATAIFIMKNFFESIPVSVEEAARIDGAGVFRTFLVIVLPMALPAVITITILSFQASWNELSHFIVASQSPELVTLTKGVAQLSSGALSQGTQYPLKLAAATIMTVPVAVMFFIFQRRIMNVGGGAVKG